ncbi:MAG: amino acid--tRNA ligase-related protein [Candidatus Moraniibacteriota bacterium]
MDVTGYARILAKRNMGGICFLKVRFQEQDTQFILTKKIIGNYREIANLPAGSIISIEGTRTTSGTGTPSIAVYSAKIVSICRIELPDKYNGVNSRTEYDNRVIGLIGNQDSFGLFKVIADMNRRVRTVLQNNGYLEFDTGVLQDSFDAGLANSFSTKCNANGREYHLSMTSEIKLKKLIAGGFERVYEMTHSFRNEGINATHYPEFGILEAYRVSDSLDDSLDVITEILNELAAASRSSVGVEPLGDAFSASPKRTTFNEALASAFGRECCSIEELISLRPDLFSKDMPGFTSIYKALTKIIAPRFDNPTFIMDMPTGFNPFCRVMDDRANQAVLVAKGMHIATMSVDENDEGAMRQRLQEQHEESEVPINTGYLDLLRIGIPPISGFGLGVTRLAMLLLPRGKQNVRDVIPFPFA